MDVVKAQGKVLIVENSLPFRTAVSAYLSGNYTVHEAASIIEGLEKAQDFMPDVILVDKKLLDQEGGQEAMGKLKSRILSSTAIILLSGQVSVDDAVAAIKSGATDFVPKPVDPQRLSQIIEHNLEQVRIRKRFQDLPLPLQSRKDESPWCFTGNLENTSATDLFQFLRFSRMTGTLEVSCGLVATSIFFMNGDVISAGSSDPREYLAHFLVSRGVIDENQLVGLMKKQDEQKVLLGKVIIQEGLADEKVVSDILIEKITDTVTNLFLQKIGIFTFYQNFVIPYMFHTVQVSVVDLIAKGEEKRQAWERIRAILPSMNSTVEWTALAEPIPAAEGGRIGARILSMIDGRHTIEEVCLETHSSEWSVLSFLYPYYEKGWLTFGASADKAPIPGWGKLLADQSVEKARRLLISGNYEQALRLLYRVCKQPDCDWRSTMPLLEDAEDQYVRWFYSEKMSSADIPYLRSTSSFRTQGLQANEGFLLSRINGTRDVRTLIHLSPVREVEVLLSLHRFLDYRLIGIRKPGALLESLEKTGERPIFPIPHQQLEEIIRDLPIGVLIAGQAGIITYANDSFMKISGLKVDQIEGLHFSQILRDQKLDQIQDSYERELVWAGIDGRSALRRHWLYSIFPFSGRETEESGATIFVRDVTDLHRKELNDRRKDRLTSLGEFVAGMTHQLKNPVMLVETAVKWLLEENLDVEEVPDIAKRMLKNVERMRNLISDTLNYVSMDESTYSMMNLNEVMEQCLPTLKDQIGSSLITLEFHPVANPPLMKGNETQIREVVINLAHNAIQAMGDRGHLNLTTDLQEELEGAVLRQYLLMVISDTGPGMSPQVVEKIFTPFFTTKQGGKGLGLAFAKRIVEEQGGFVRCWSKEGIGTHFYVYFRIGERNAFHLARG